MKVAVADYSINSRRVVLHARAVPLTPAKRSLLSAIGPHRNSEPEVLGRAIRSYLALVACRPAFKRGARMVVVSWMARLAAHMIMKTRSRRDEQTCLLVDDLRRAKQARPRWG